MLRTVDWCELELRERSENLGLGRSIRAGMTEVFDRHAAALVFEDDLVCVPGTYLYLTGAMERYWDDPRVLSVTGWSHPRVTPRDVVDQPYFDGRAECWVWGAWPRSWRGMDSTATEIVEACAERGIDPFRYGDDLREMAAAELDQNTWAVRFLLLHILRGGLCLRPPHSLVEHIGWGPDAANASTDSGWSNPPLRACPRAPESWPEPAVHPRCAELWREAFGLASRRSPWRLGLDRLKRKVRTVVRGPRQK
jgi:hypothetical protein